MKMAVRKIELTPKLLKSQPCESRFTGQSTPKSEEPLDFTVAMSLRQLSLSTMSHSRKQLVTGNVKANSLRAYGRRAQEFGGFEGRSVLGPTQPVQAGCAVQPRSRARLKR